MPLHILRIHAFSDRLLYVLPSSGSDDFTYVGRLENCAADHIGIYAAMVGTRDHCSGLLPTMM